MATSSSAPASVHVPLLLSFTKARTHFLREVFDRECLYKASNCGLIDGKLARDLRRYANQADMRGNREGRDAPSFVGVLYRTKAHGFGRLYPRIRDYVGGDFIPTQTMMQRELRACIAHTLVHDLDLVNCQPEIAVQVYRHHGIPCSLQSRYCEERDVLLQQLMDTCGVSRDVAKELVIASGFGGHLDRWARDHRVRLDDVPAFFRKLNAEMWQAMHRLVMLYPEYLVAACDSLKSEYDGDVRRVPEHRAVRSATALFMQTKERQIVELLVEGLKANCETVTAIVFDGVHVRRKVGRDSFPVDMLNFVSDFIYRRSGFRVCVREKHFEVQRDYLDHENEDRFPELGVPGVFPAEAAAEAAEAPAVVVHDDDEASTVFIQANGARLAKHRGELYVKGEKDHLWHVHGPMVKHAMLAMALRMNLVRPSATGSRAIPYSKNVKLANCMLMGVEAKVPEDPSFYDNMWHSTLGRLCFRDGVYDFDSRQFLPWEACPDVMSTHCIPRVFPRRVQADVDEVNRRFWDVAFPNKAERKHMKRMLARKLAAKYEDKSFVVVQTMRNGSKGVQATLLQNAFGPYVVGTNTENFSPASGSSNTAKDNAWMFALQFSRVAIASEAKHTDGNRPVILDGDKIKKVCSGGDRIGMRLNYMDEFEGKLQAGPVFYVNRIPRIEPVDAAEFMHIISSPAKFKAEHEMTEADRRNPYVHPANPHFKSTWCREDRILDAFTHTLLDAYSNSPPVPPESVVETMEVYLEGNGQERDIAEFFKVDTSNPALFLSNGEITSLITARGLNLGLNDVQCRLMNLGCLRHRNQRGVRGLKFVKLREE